MKLFEEIIKGFAPIHLDEMDNVKLMNRADEKYLIHIDLLPSILKRASQTYQALEINHKRIMGYENLYYDTSDHLMYRLHHNQKLNRHKIRIRQYLDSQKFLLEVKFKNNKGKTQKQRITVGSFDSISEPASRDFIAAKSPYVAEQLEAKLSTAFERISIVNTDLGERVTMDFNLTLQNDNKRFTIPDLVIMEIKHEHSFINRGFNKLLLDERIFPKRISKYCLGTNLLYPEVKHNRFKAKILYLNKLDTPKQYDKRYSAII